MAAVHSRLATFPHRCGWCGHLIHPGGVIARILVGSTESTGCLDCAWKAENKQLHEKREKS